MKNSAWFIDCFCGQLAIIECAKVNSFTHNDLDYAVIETKDGTLKIVSASLFFINGKDCYKEAERIIESSPTLKKKILF